MPSDISSKTYTAMKGKLKTEAAGGRDCFHGHAFWQKTERRLQ